MSEPAGFFYPRTATGRASLLPAPPWHYSGNLLTVELSLIHISEPTRRS